MSLFSTVPVGAPIGRLLSQEIEQALVRPRVVVDQAVEVGGHRWSLGPTIDR